ncbi:MAG: tripartite tricarboxylate transporter substrate binding protein [Pseudomonadota bacterium]
MTLLLARRGIAALAATALAGQALAQEGPRGPLRLIVPQPPGGAADALARLLADPMARSLGRPIVVDNRAGANGTVAVNALKSMRNDGSAILLGGVSLFSFNPNLYSNLPYDAARDFTYIAPVVETALVLIASRRSGITSVAQLVERARAEPERLTYASVGIGNSTHLSMEMLTDTAGVRMTHVPFTGSATSMTSVLTGETDCMVIPLNTPLPHILAGTLVPLAILGSARAAALPEVPTLKETGFEGLVMPTWYAIVGPAGMPAAAVERINAAVRAAVVDPDTARKLREGYLEPMTGSAQFVRDSVEADSASWGAFIRRRNLRVE